ncbi:hypothetical protein [Arthrobacter pityocampae]|uniref:hypothetical protein n=1 Tax=Arthrobacter pityocampae TaxID=547334 RepID=UPI001F4EFC6E|nr:hypothetical protein [Arthrobacter pityocampae]
MLVLSGILAAVTIRNPTLSDSDHPTYCAVDGTPSAPGALREARGEDGSPS